VFTYQLPSEYRYRRQRGYGVRRRRPVPRRTVPRWGKNRPERHLAPVPGHGLMLAPELPGGGPWAEHDAVEDAAWRTPGVYDVHDKLAVTG